MRRWEAGKEDPENSYMAGYAWGNVHGMKYHICFILPEFLTYSDKLQVHPCCYRWHYFVLFYGWVTVHYKYVPHLLHPSTKILLKSLIVPGSLSTCTLFQPVIDFPAESNSGELSLYPVLGTPSTSLPGRTPSGFPRVPESSELLSSPSQHSMASLVQGFMRHRCSSPGYLFTKYLRTEVVGNRPDVHTGSPHGTLQPDWGLWPSQVEEWVPLKIAAWHVTCCIVHPNTGRPSGVRVEERKGWCRKLM